MVDLGSLGGPESWANNVNNGGQIVGYSSIDASGTQHAFLHNGSGPLIDLGTLGGPQSVAWGINNLGQVVGTGGTRGKI